MSRVVFCRKYQKDMEGLDRAPMPGPRGQDLLAHVSRQAWQEWQKLQTMLINEKKLSLMDPDARAWLAQQMDLFLSNADYAKPEGYTPPKS